MDPMDLTPIVTLVSAGTAIIAAGVTAWMAVETRRMATAARLTIEHDRSPILGVRDIRVEIVAGGGNGTATSSPAPSAVCAIRIGVELFNAGRVPVKYAMRSMLVTFVSRTMDSARFLSRGGRILPGSSTIFWHPSVPLDPPVATVPATGRVRCDFEYGSESVTETQSIVATMEYVVGGAAPGSPVSWLFVDEPPAS